MQFQQSHLTNIPVVAAGDEGWDWQLDYHRCLLVLINCWPFQYYPLTRNWRWSDVLLKMRRKFGVRIWWLIMTSFSFTEIPLALACRGLVFRFSSVTPSWLCLQRCSAACLIGGWLVRNFINILWNAESTELVADIIEGVGCEHLGSALHQPTNRYILAFSALRSLF